jgi:hypothetical protein
MSTLELQANARAWGASGRVAFNEFSAYVRSLMLTRVERLPNEISFQDVPSNAVYVVSAVHFGHMYEVHMQGAQAAVEAQVNILIGAVEGRAASSQVQSMRQSNGLTPRAGLEMQALAAASEQQIAANFDVSGEPQAILIEFMSVRPAPLYRMQVVALKFPARKLSGAAWDPLGGDPDMRVAFSQGGRQVVYCDAARDRSESRFTTPCVLPDLYFDSSNPLTIRFLDLDLSAHDPAGDAIVAELHTSPELAVSARQTAARVWLRVERVDAPANSALSSPGVNPALAAAATGGSSGATVRVLQATGSSSEARDGSGRARQLDAGEVRGLLVGRTVDTPSGSTWRFEATEPLASRIESQREQGNVSIVEVFVETNSIDGTQPARGRIRLTLTWVNGQPVFRGASPIDFQIIR